jgi:hypothetical protein
VPRAPAAPRRARPAAAAFPMRIMRSANRTVT